MHPDPFDREHELVGGERLRLELAEPRPVEGVGEVRAECLEVEVVGAATHLLVHGEGDSERRARAGRRAGAGRRR